MSPDLVTAAVLAGVFLYGAEQSDDAVWFVLHYAGLVLAVVTLVRLVTTW